MTGLATRFDQRKSVNESAGRSGVIEKNVPYLGTHLIGWRHRQPHESKGRLWMNSYELWCSPVRSNAQALRMQSFTAQGSPTRSKRSEIPFDGFTSYAAPPWILFDTNVQSPCDAAIDVSGLDRQF
jgi:hypothetical protein